MGKSIDRLDQMRAIAHGWAVPASVGISFSSVFYGPKHTSDGNLRILGEGQTMLSESGTYTLILQTDHNLVLYENRVDGLTSWSSKSAIWHVQGGPIRTWSCRSTATSFSTATMAFI